MEKQRDLRSFRATAYGQPGSSRASFSCKALAAPRHGKIDRAPAGVLTAQARVASLAPSVPVSCGNGASHATTSDGIVATITTRKNVR